MNSFVVIGSFAFLVPSAVLKKIDCVAAVVKDSVFSLGVLKYVCVRGVTVCAFSGRTLARGHWKFWKAFQWSPTGRVEIKLTILWL